MTARLERPLTQSRRTFALATAGALATIGMMRAPARAAQFEFKGATLQAADHPVTVAVKLMWAAVEDESGGRIHAEYYPNGILGNDQGMLSEIRLGAIQVMILTPAVLASTVPACEIGYLGFVYSDVAEALRTMDGALGEYLRSEIKTKGMTALKTMWDTGMLQVGAATRPIRTPADFNGFKIGATNSKIALDMFKELGASAVPISASTRYTSLQTKLVDGITAPLDVIEASKLYEVSKYVSLTNHAWSGVFQLFNSDVWSKLPSDLQDIVERNNTKFALAARKESVSADASLAAKLRAQGSTFNQVDQAPFRAQLRGYYASCERILGTKEWSLLQESLGRKV